LPRPDEVLNEEFLKPLGMSINALAIALRVPATRIGAIVKGERAVTADAACLEPTQANMHEPS
jgi:addiction module HigA family antidote